MDDLRASWGRLTHWQRALLIGGGLVIAYAALSTVQANLAGSLTPDASPADTAEIEARLAEVVGDRLNGKSEAEASAMVAQWAWAGLDRLDDARLLRRHQLRAEAVGNADIRLCARVALASPDHPLSDDEVFRFLALLPDDEEIEYWGIIVDAVEASVEERSRMVINDAQGAELFAAVRDRMSPVHQETLRLALAGEPVSDEAACAALRESYAIELGLEPPLRASVVRYLAQSGPREWRWWGH